MKTHPLKHLFIAACVAVTAGAVLSQDEGTQFTPSYSDTPAQQFVWEAGCAGIKEIKLSEIALRRSRDTGVRDFAQMIVRDHTSANSELWQIAQRKNLEFPTDTYLRGSNAAVQLIPPRSEAIGPTVSRHNLTPRIHVVPANQGTRELSDRGYPAFASTTNSVEYVRARLLSQESVRRLESASDADFDRVYLTAMSDDHTEAIRKFEEASRLLDDADLKEFASSNLPKLREHLDRATQLVRTPIEQPSTP